jgi:hypothetical protein
MFGDVRQRFGDDEVGQLGDGGPAVADELGDLLDRDAGVG